MGHFKREAVLMLLVLVGMFVLSLVIAILLPQFLK